jgi:putative ABC transport system permease protein
MIDSSRIDFRVALRRLRRDRGFTALSVGVLALGICAVATQFSVVNGVYLRGFSFPNGERLTSVQLTDPSRANAFGVPNQQFALDYVEMREQQTTLERMAAYINGATVNMTIDGNALRFTGAYVTDEFLEVLGIRPLLGRDFEPADNQPGAPKVAIISHELWQRDFGGRDDVLGKAVRLNGKPATIVGVMDRGFAFPINEQLWIPLFNEYPPLPRTDQNAAGNTVNVVGALRADATLDQANAEYAAIAKRLADSYPDTNKQFAHAQVEPLIRTFSPPFLRGLLLTMLAFCAGVLVLACVNVMNMQFARATLRAKELAVRSSLGASRWRLIRQMLAESALLAGTGAVLGVAGSLWTTGRLQAAMRSLANPIPAYIEFTIDGPVLGFVVAAAVAATLLSGLVPAYLASRAKPSEVLKDAGRGNSGRLVGRFNRALVVAQIVVTCVLLIGSMLQLQSILRQQEIDHGYDTESVLSARMGLMEGDYPDSARRQIFYDRALRELRANPQYADAALTSRFRMLFTGGTPIEIEGRSYATDADRPNVNFENVSDGYFATLGARLLEGRDFAADDSDAKLPVAIVNAGFAAKHFGNESPLGRRFRTTNPDGTQPGPWRTVIGVVSDLRMIGPFNNPFVDGTGFYVPFFASAVGPAVVEAAAPQFATVLVRPRDGQRAELLANALRGDMRKLDPNLPLYFVSTPEESIDGVLGQPRIIAVMFSIFGLVAVVLSAVGLYGVMSFAVSQRTQELGTRMALGAGQREILRMILGQGLRQLGVGLALGVGAALAIAQLGGDGIRQALFQVDPRDPLTYAAVTSLITLVAFVATLMPARRATRVDPMIALRAE